MREIALDQIPTMVAIQPAERRINYHGQRPSGYLFQGPQQCKCIDLLLACRKVALHSGLSVGIHKLYLEVMRVPGGWIYKREACGEVWSPAHESNMETTTSVSQVFVPFTKEGLARGLG